MAWESRIVGHGEAAPAYLVGNPRNWRTHPKAQRDALAGVLDPFAGSGTTLIAAEITGRRCLAMELEPQFVQVAIKRWEAFTGLKAKRI